MLAAHAQRLEASLIGLHLRVFAEGPFGRPLLCRSSCMRSARILTRRLVAAGSSTEPERPASEGNDFVERYDAR